MAEKSTQNRQPSAETDLPSPVVPGAPSASKVKLRLNVRNGTYLSRKLGKRWSNDDGMVQEVEAKDARELLELQHVTYDENGHASTVRRFLRVEDAVAA
jgi:hypothetical protein